MGFPGARLDEKQKAKIVELYTKHRIATKDIAERYGVQAPAIVRALREAGVDVDQNRKPYPQ